MLNHLLNFQSDGSTSELERRILESQPLLEAFGNAKTTLNDNSSRFGKYIVVQFNRGGTVVGAEIHRYLLEKSRLVAHNEGEANFHVLYYLINGAPAAVRRSLGVAGELDYHYMLAGDAANGAAAGGADGAGWSMSDTAREKREKKKKKMNRRSSSKYEYAGVAPVTDVEKYEELVETLQVMEFNEAEILTVHTLVAAVLEIGNIDFKPSSEPAAGGGGSGAVLLSPQQLDHAARLLRVGSNELEKRLCTRSITVGGETILKPIEVNAARALRDSLAKGLYSAVFGWMVDRANMLLRPSTSECLNREGYEAVGADAADAADAAPSHGAPAGAAGGGGGGSKVLDGHDIGVLDIFGFENFQTNGFEQLCINAANEQLQHYFVQHIFKWEHDEYAKEGVVGSKGGYTDNSAVVNLILGRPVCLQPHHTINPPPLL